MRLENFFFTKYPKLCLLFIIILFSYYFFSRPFVADTLAQLGQISYLGIFFAGLLFSFGFTAPIAVGLLITLQPEHLFVASLIGGIGAMCSDLFIFHTIKVSFLNEFRALQKTQLYAFSEKTCKNIFPRRIRTYLLFLFAGFVIASPLPDEIGVALLAGFTNIRRNVLAIFSFFLNTAGIFIILLLSR